MTIRQLAEYLSLIKEELQDKEVIILMENGLKLTPTIKFFLKDPGDLTKDNVLQAIITYQNW